MCSRQAHTTSTACWTRSFQATTTDALRWAGQLGPGTVSLGGGSWGGRVAARSAARSACGGSVAAASRMTSRPNGWGLEKAGQLGFGEGQTAGVWRRDCNEARGVLRLQTAGWAQTGWLEVGGWRLAAGG
eukprot:358279-Chlamydomonas_euryale.AAC.2